MKKFPAACSLNSFSPGSGAPRRHRRGIALLIVIGLTAMLMLLGAAFAIYMRTERMASGNFKNDVRARQLLHVALARAMDTVETSCNNAIYPPFDVLYPTNSGGGVVDAALTSWGATNYLPRGAFVTSSWASVNANIGWVPLTVGQAGSFEDVRYAYVVLNVSGLFDANQVGISGARGAGTNVQEIDLSDVPDANNLPAAPSFQTMPNLFTTGATNNFVVFQPYLRTNVLVDLSGDEDALMGRRADIIQALKACGINNSTELVFSNLLDYVDAGNIPKDLASSCTEKVPMINEIRKKDRFVITVNTGTTNLQYRSYMDVECWYPFMEPAANDYWLAYQIDFTVVPSNFPAPASVSGQQRLILGASGFYHLPSEIACLSSSQPLGSSDLSSTVRIDAHVRFQVYEGAFGVGTIVDASPYPTNQPLSVVGTASLLLGSLPIGSSWTTNGLECFDPRCNWMASSASR
ncbi:MAG: hypothetical protein WCL16_01435 [bacterium]